MRILVVEDEADLNLLLCKVLTKAGYTVDGCLDGEDAQAHLLGAAYDGILLDVMLPKKDGYTLVRELRDQGNDTPVLFLTARDSVADRVKGLDLGGDDYLVKPFSYTELISRVKAMLRRYYVYGAKAPEQSKVLRCCGNIEIDLNRCVVRRDGQEVVLTDTEYRILCLLATHPKKVFSVQNIYESIWDEPFLYTSNNTVMVHIRNIRRKLGDDPQNCQTIRTVWGRGYRIE